MRLQSVVLSLGLVLSVIVSSAAGAKGTVKWFDDKKGFSLTDTGMSMPEYEKLKVLVAEIEDELPKGGVRNGPKDTQRGSEIGLWTAQGRSPDLQQEDNTASPRGWLVPPGNGELPYWQWLAGVRTITLGRIVELDLRTEGKGQTGAGTAVLRFLGFTGGTELSLACRDLVPGEEHLVCTYDADLERMQDIGKFIVTDQGTGYLRVRLSGDITGLSVTVVPIDSSEALTTFARKCYSLSFLALVSETDEQDDHLTKLKTQGRGTQTK